MYAQAQISRILGVYYQTLSKCRKLLILPLEKRKFGFRFDLLCVGTRIGPPPPMIYMHAYNTLIRSERLVKFFFFL